MVVESYKVTVGRDHLVFCCGHFISYDGHQCERLHGHNYRASVEIEGPLTDDYYVFDFVALLRLSKAVTDELDHHMLIATKNPVIHVHASERSLRVNYKDREWIFPKEDCVLLPIENTTAELIAKYIGGRLMETLPSVHGSLPKVIRVEVEENVGQSATYEVRTH